MADVGWIGQKVPFTCADVFMVHVLSTLPLMMESLTQLQPQIHRTAHSLAMKRKILVRNWDVWKIIWGKKCDKRKMKITGPAGVFFMKTIPWLISFLHYILHPKYKLNLSENKSNFHEWNVKKIRYRASHQWMTTLVYLFNRKFWHAIVF